MTLTKYEPQHVQVSEIKNDLSLSQIGELFFNSKLFPDIASASQAMVKILAGREMGFDPFSSMNGFHIIKGKVEASADLIARKIKSSGMYDYRVIEMSDDKVSLEFWELSKLTGKWETAGISTFTKEDAARAGTQNMGKFPRNMLFARALTNGNAWFCPDVSSVRMYGEGELSGTLTTLPEPEPEKEERQSSVLLGKANAEASRLKGLCGPEHTKLLEAVGKFERERDFMPNETLEKAIAYFQTHINEMLNPPEEENPFDEELTFIKKYGTEQDMVDAHEAIKSNGEVEAALEIIISGIKDK